MQASTICSKCHKKGSCCDEFHLLAIHGWFDTKEQSEKHLEVSIPKLKELVPVFEYKRQKQGNDGCWTAMFGCTKVLPNGLCSIYEERPDVCRTFEPLSDSLCVIKHLKGIPIFVEETT